MSATTRKRDSRPITTTMPQVADSRIAGTASRIVVERPSASVGATRVRNDKSMDMGRAGSRAHRPQRGHIRSARSACRIAQSEWAAALLRRSRRAVKALRWRVGTEPLLVDFAVLGVARACRHLLHHGVHPKPEREVAGF